MNFQSASIFQLCARIAQSQTWDSLLVRRRRQGLFVPWVGKPGHWLLYLTREPLAQSHSQLAAQPIGSSPVNL